MTISRYKAKAAKRGGRLQQKANRRPAGRKAAGGIFGLGPREEASRDRSVEKAVKSGKGGRLRDFAGGFPEAVLVFLHQLERAANPTEIAAALAALPGFDRHRLKETLDELCRRDWLVCRRNRYTLAPELAIYPAELSMHQRGFGFAMLSDPAVAADFGKDIFLPPDSLGGAIHGDKILVLVVKRRADRAEGRVLRVLDRGISRLVGLYVAGSGSGLVVPEDDRLPFKVVVRRPQSNGARNGEAVVVEISSFRERGNPEGRIVEVLGDPAEPAVQIEISIRSFELPHRFAPSLLAGVEALDEHIGPEAGRLDLRAIPHVTIDSETARDFDDAVAAEPLPDDGIRLYVSIADVSHYVRPGSELDREAYARGTSVYFPGRVVPMLPERLSNHLCSLVPDQERYTMSAILDFDRRGRRRAASFGKSLIRSRRRLTYNEVKAMLEDGDGRLRERHAEVMPSLELLAELAPRLNRVRLERGSIGFEIPEADIQLDDNGHIQAIGRSRRNMAHKLIEECMLAANEAVAEFLEQRQAPALYRIHEDPDPVKVAEFAEFAAAMGLDLPKLAGRGVEPGPGWFGRVLELAAGTPREYIVSNLLLRTMQQARYAPENTGHFGLAASHYTHFTSPIRRYPDLLVHRVLAGLSGPTATGKAAKAAKVLMAEKAAPKRRQQPAPVAADSDLAASGRWLSKRERVAVDAERDATERLVALYMADRVGEEFAAVVSGISSFGMFVELEEIMISGAVALADMKDDYYEVEEKSHRLIGRRSGQVYQIGNSVRVRLAAVDQRRRRLNFVVVP